MSPSTLLSLSRPMTSFVSPAPKRSALVWLRRDLRCTDHAALYYALRDYAQVHCVFVYDTEILDALPSRSDRRVAFIHACVGQLDAALRALAAQHGVEGSGLMVRHGAARECVPELAQALGVDAVLTNRDYEPAALARDAAVAQALEAMGMGFHAFKDHVLLECEEVLNQQGKPYSVFTPYHRAWLQKLDAFQRSAYPVERYAHRLAPMPVGQPRLSLRDLGFEDAALPDGVQAGSAGAQAALHSFATKLDAYAQARDFPALPGSSQLSVHLRFGTVSVRQVAAWAWERAAQGSDGAHTWLKQLAWRDFYCMILWFRPDVVQQCYRPECDRIAWDDAPDLWQAWCDGRTGYPLVDAAMRQLRQTGWMHNRLRMVAASFLTKDLGIDWREGERYFAQHLLDYDLAANNGGWQWAASTGCDAQPWFRIFNPTLQSQRFDPDGDFIRHYVPELAGLPARAIHCPAAMKPQALKSYGVELGVHYPHPVVDHGSARARTLMRFHFLSADGARPDARQR